MTANPAESLSPYSEESERGFLGAVLQEPGRIFNVLCNDGLSLPVEAFFIPSNRVVWETLLAMRDGGKPIDSLMVPETLRQSGRLDEIGGTTFLDQLIDGCPTTAHALYYARQVADFYRRRQVLEASRAVSACIESGGDPAGALAQLDTVRESRQAYGIPDGWMLSDILGFVPEPTDHVAGNGWLRRGAGTLLIGSTGIGKSVLVEQVAVCVSAGLAFFGIQVRQPRRVLLVEAENDLETLKRDFGGILGHLAGADGLTCPLLVHAGLTVRRCAGRTGSDFFDWLRLALTTDKPDLLVLDPLQSFLGAVDVNNSQAWLAFQTPMDAVLQEHNLALLLTCHTPKPKVEQDTRTARQSVYDAVGSSALSNWCRASATLAECPDGRFRLRLGKNAERAGLVDEHDGRMLRDLYIL